MIPSPNTCICIPNKMQLFILLQTLLECLSPPLDILKKNAGIFKRITMANQEFNS
ncbi:hypothetical protein Hanom_Chr07g00595741 [Helianthus anomalus]